VVAVSFLGQPERFLGMEITHSKSGLYITQADYIQKLLDKFEFSDINIAKTPMETSRDASRRLVKLEHKVANPKEYQELVGSLIHASTYTHPDISYTTKELSKHLLAHDKTHFDAVKRCFRYLKGVKHTGLFASRKGKFQIDIYVDADWASDKDTRRSTSGMVMLVDNMVVAYSSKEQKSVALSTCEAELFAISQAIRLVGYLRQVLLELKIITKDYCFTIYSDSQSAIALLKNESAQIPAKHIDLRLKYIQEKLVRGEVELIYIPSADNLADICTKPLGIDSHTRLTSRLLRSLPSIDSRGC
jgi:hypothetical protein